MPWVQIFDKINFVAIKPSMNVIANVQQLKINIEVDMQY